MVIEVIMKYEILRDSLNLFLCILSLAMYGIIVWFWPLTDVSFIPYAIKSLKEFDLVSALPYVGAIVFLRTLINFISYFKIKNIAAPTNVSGNYLGLGDSVIDPRVKLSKWLVLKAMSNFNWVNYLFMLIFSITLECTRFAVYFNLILYIDKLVDSGTNVAVAIALPIMILLWSVTEAVLFNNRKSWEDTRMLNRINTVKMPIYYAILGLLLIYSPVSIIPVLVASLIVEVLLITPIYYLLISRHAFAKNEPLSLSLAYDALMAHRDHCKGDHIDIEEPS
jgi:hypothetical protein